MRKVLAILFAVGALSAARSGAVESGDTARLLGLFKKETPKGEPRNPDMLPLGRVVVKLQGGATLKRGELDPFTGLGKLFLSDGKVIEIAMSKKSRMFAMRAVGGDVQGEPRFRDQGRTGPQVRRLRASLS